MPPARRHAQFEHGGHMPSDQGGHGGQPADHRAREEPPERPRRWRSEKALNRAARRAVQRLLRSPPARSLRRFLTRPVVCWLAPVAALIGWHVPAVFELGVRSRWWHDLQAASFFATGVLFWLPVVRWRAGVVRSEEH